MSPPGSFPLKCPLSKRLEIYQAEALIEAVSQHSSYHYHIDQRHYAVSTVFCGAIVVIEALSLLSHILISFSTIPGTTIQGFQFPVLNNTSSQISRIPSLLIWDMAMYWPMHISAPVAAKVLTTA